MSSLVGTGEHVANEELSFTHVITKGQSDVIRIGSKVTYRVLRGEGDFFVGEGPDSAFKETVTEGDVVTIPLGAVFSTNGNLIMRATFEPPYDPSQLEVIKHHEVSSAAL